jgi:RNA polymerase sigma-70 factor (ECF subfamily)
LSRNSISASLQDSAFRLRRVAAVSQPLAGKVGLEDEIICMFEQFRGSLLRYLMALGLNPYDGEEVVQEVFLALFRHLSQGKSRQNLRGWIFRVAHNLGLKLRNQTQQQCEHVREIARTECGLQPVASLNPEQQFLRSERQERLRAVVRALPEQDQWCLYLRAEGLRYREIAATLEISLGAVSLSLGRSLARLARVDGR